MAQHIMAGTTRSSPLIAVNPVYMHPFTAAKFVSSFAQLYGRKVYLNMITGTAVSDLQGLGDEQSHADRYVRLGEFVALMRQLLASPRPVNFEGRFYRASNLQLRPRLPTELMPEFLIAGQSEAAQRVAKETGCIKMQMLPPNLFDPFISPLFEVGIARVPRFLVGIVAGGVVTADESPARIGAAILVGAVQQVAMEEDR